MSTQEQEQGQEPLPRLYTLAEVEQIAQVSRRTLYLWIESDYLHAVKVGGRWRVPQAELDALIEGRKGSYQRREYAAGKPVGYTREARARKTGEPLTPLGQSRYLSAALKEAASAQGITQKQLSDKTGIPLTTLHRKLNHVSAFKAGELGAVTEALGLSLAALAEEAERNE